MAIIFSVMRALYALISFKPKVVTRRLSPEEVNLLEHYRYLSEADRTAMRYPHPQQRSNVVTVKREPRHPIRASTRYSLQPCVSLLAAFKLLIIGDLCIRLKTADS